MRIATAALAAATLATAAPFVACADPVGDAPRAQVVAGAPAAAAGAAKAAVPRGAVHLTFLPDTSSIGFVGAKVTKSHPGGFKSFTGTIDAPRPDPATATIDVVIDMASTFTDNERLTAHLLKPDFFDVARFPQSRFTSTSIAKNADGTYTITGDLTLHGVTKRIAFPATIDVQNDVARARAEFGINRKDFGIVYTGKADDLVRDEVLMKLDIQAHREAPRG